MKNILIFATGNQNKVKEVTQILGSSWTVQSLKDIGHTEEVPETQNTIEGNAIQKANFISNRYQSDCFAEDTGLEVEALNGAPGVYSARYAGPQKNAHDNMIKLMDALKFESNRKARFKTVIAYRKGKVQ